MKRWRVIWRDLTVTTGQRQETMVEAHSYRPPGGDGMVHQWVNDDGTVVFVIEYGQLLNAELRV